MLSSYGTLPLAARIDAWLNAQAIGVSRVKSLLAEIQARPTVDIAAVSVALRTLRGLISQTSSEH